MKRYLQRSDGRTQRYNVGKNFKKRYHLIGKNKGRNVYAKIKKQIQKEELYRNLAALSYSPLLASDDDYRVWVHSQKPDEFSAVELERELSRFTSALRTKGIFEGGSVRTEIGQQIGSNELEPNHAEIGVFYGYANIKGYQYTGEKKGISWTIRNKSGLIISKKRRDDL